MIYTTLREKFILKYASTNYLDVSVILFNKVYKGFAFYADYDHDGDEDVWCYEEKIKSRLLEIFDGDEKKLKQYLFHDWKCYLYQFSVIANGSEWYMAINPDTVLSTVINLGMYNVHESCSRSTKVNCAEILKKRRPVSNLVEKWLGNSINTKDCFSFVHDCINFTEKETGINEITQKISDLFRISVFPDLVYSYEERYYDYDYIRFLYNFGKLKKQEKIEAFDFREIWDLFCRIGYFLFKQIQNEELVIHVNSIQNLNILNFYDIFINSVLNFTNQKNKDYMLVENYTGPKFSRKTIINVADILLDLFKYVSNNNLNNCHVECFEKIFCAISSVGWNKILSMLNDVFNEQTHAKWTNFITEKNNFYSIVTSIYNEANNIYNESFTIKRSSS